MRSLMLFFGGAGGGAVPEGGGGVEVPWAAALEKAPPIITNTTARSAGRILMITSTGGDSRSLSGKSQRRGPVSPWGRRARVRRARARLPSLRLAAPFAPQNGAMGPRREVSDGPPAPSGDRAAPLRTPGQVLLTHRTECCQFSVAGGARGRSVLPRVEGAVREPILQTSQRDGVRMDMRVERADIRRIGIAMALLVWPIAALTV